MESARVDRKTGFTVDVARKGDRVIVNQGPFVGLAATVIDPIAIPDNLPNRRKIEVRLDGSDYSVFILPRQLDLAEDPTYTNPMTNAQQAALATKVN